MKKMRNLLGFALIAILLVGLAACEEEENTLSPKESKQVLESFDSQIQSDFTEMENAEGMEAIATLQNMPDPFSTSKSTKEGSQIFTTLEENLLLNHQNELKSVKGSEPFEFDALVGTYEWNIEYEMWDISHGDPADKIVIIFPSDETQTTNDVTLTLHDYEEQEFSDGLSTYYEPTLISADLYIGETKYVDIAMTASYNAEAIPIEMSASVMLIPFEFTVDFSETSTTTTIEQALYISDEKVMSVGAAVEFKTTDKIAAKEFDGFLQYRDVKVDGTVDIEGLENISFEGAESQQDIVDAINNEMDIAIYQNSTGDKMADIEFALVGEGADQSMELVLVFADGSEELAEPYFENFITEIENFLSELEISLDSYYDF